MIIILGLCDTPGQVLGLIPECNVPYDMWNEDTTKHMGTHWRYLTSDGWLIQQFTYNLLYPVVLSF